MAVITRHTIEWSGFHGAPGFSNFYSLPSDDAAFHSALGTWMHTWAANLPDDVVLTLKAETTQIEDTTGQIVAAGSFAADDSVQGANTGGYSAASGVVVNWKTGGIVAGKRARGRTFMVPISGGAYQTDGTIDSNALQFMRTSTATFQIAVQGQLVVWSRPFKGDLTHPARVGSNHVVTSSSIPDKVAVLRSRRD